MISRFAVAIVAMLTGLIATSGLGSAFAQDAAEDWEFVDVDTATAASVSFDNGLAVVIRCQGESLETYVRGMSLAPVENASATRIIDYAFGETPLRKSSWQVSQNGQALFADLPASMARRFREGGSFQMRLAAEGSNPARRYVVELPRSPSSIDRVLGACDRPLVDPRDALRVNEAATGPTDPALDPEWVGPSWQRHPQPGFPEAAVRAGATNGMAVFSCLVNEDGTLDECRVEVERPAGVNFGRQGLRAVRGSRLTPGSAARFAGNGIVTFTIRWALR